VGISHTMQTMFASDLAGRGLRYTTAIQGRPKAVRDASNFPLAVLAEQQAGVLVGMCSWKRG
jgi:hypothetical protein